MTDELLVQHFKRALLGNSDNFEYLTSTADDGVFKLCDSKLREGNKAERAMAAAILGDFGLPNEAVDIRRTVGRLLVAVEHELDLDVTIALVDALGSRGDDAALDALLELTKNDLSELRSRVAANLPFVWGANVDSRVVNALLHLAVDEAEDVRFWSVVALGEQMSTCHINQSKADEVLHFLHSVVTDDPEEAIRFEAQQGIQSWARNWETRADE